MSETPTEMLRPDLCIIGGGSGGLSIAAAAAMMRVPVVLIERGRMGGDCLNVGCVPSKAMIAAARHARVHAEPAFGFPATATITADFAAVHAHVRQVIAEIAPNDSEARFGALGVRVIKAEGRFIAPDAVRAGSVEIRARRFVIATGSRPAMPDVPGIADVEALTNETIFDLTERPRHLLVLGAGPIGLELAQAHARLGSKVTVIEANAALGREDPEAAAVVVTALRREGIDVRERLSVARAERTADGLALDLSDGGRVEGSHLLVAAGRTYGWEGLGLDAAGIGMANGRIVVDPRLRTSNRRVYAVGDAAGGQQYTHLASHHAGVVIRNALFRLPARADRTPIPRVTYTAPEIAAVGLSEAEAFAAGGKVSVLRWPFSENDRARTEGLTDGFVKVLVGAKGRVLGAVVVGEHAGDLIAPWVLAMAENLPVRSIANLVLPYPTRSEASKRAAVQSLLSGLRNPWLPGVLRILRSFG